jgi:hypothetical protein
MTIALNQMANKKSRLMHGRQIKGRPSYDYKNMREANLSLDADAQACRSALRYKS